MAREEFSKRTRELWVKRIERWQASQLDVEEFAAEIGVHPQSIRNWKRRLETEADSALIDATTREVSKQPLTFIEMKPPTAQASSIEIVLPSRISVRIGHDFDAIALKRVLDVLERR